MKSIGEQHDLHTIFTLNLSENYNNIFKNSMAYILSDSVKSMSYEAIIHMYSTLYSHGNIHYIHTKIE